MHDTSFLDYERLQRADQLRIEEISSAYESALRAGQAPALESFLEHGTRSCRGPLFAELLALDLAYRPPGRGVPPREEYTARFPTLATIVDQVYAELEPAQPGRSADDSAAPGPLLPRLPGHQELPRLRGYEVLEILGRGGMGIVYKARHIQLKRLVALKMLLHGDFASQHQLARFLVEGEALARLRHPHIVQVFEAGEQDGRPFLALEYVDGGTLRDRLQQQCFTPAEAAELTEQLARAIHHAHLQGIVHRDLKPANVLLESMVRGPASDATAVHHGPRTLDYGLPKITDFGLARYTEGASGLSLAGQVMGTPAYMAPEQARGEANAGPAVDIYALGIVLYELLAGRVPFSGDSGVDIIKKVCDEEPLPPSRLNSAIPSDLETICLKCLHKDSEQRYDSALALAEDLQRWRNGEPITARPVGRVEYALKWMRRKPALAGLVTISALFLAAMIVGPSVAALRLQQERNRTDAAERQRRADLVRAVQSALPDSLPWMLETLAPARDEVIPQFRTQLAAATDDDSRRRFAIALTLLGDPQIETLAGLAVNTPAPTSRILSLAFQALPHIEARAALHQRAVQTTNRIHQARYAILLLELGDLKLALDLLRALPDPTSRATLINEFQNWHGSLGQLPDLLDTCQDGDCQSGLCAAIGGVDPASVSLDTRAALIQVLQRLYQETEDSGTHAASAWALRRWGHSPPNPTMQVRSGERGWFTNSLGMKLIRMPAGTMPVSRGVFVNAQSCYMADCEVTIAQFRSFLAETANAQGERPEPWPGPEPGRAGDDHIPIHNISRHQAFLFCNWLSQREGRRPCYRRLQPKGTKWLCDPEEDGYRLPTEGEWEYGCRCQARTMWAFGDDPRWLPQYAWVDAVHPAVGGSRLPNRWGFFDMMGNLWEACWTAKEAVLPGVYTLPAHATDTGVEAASGGGCDSGIHNCRPESRVSAGWRQSMLTIRVLCRDLQARNQSLPGSSN